jgi:flagellar motor switch protein FliN/FliY
MNITALPVDNACNIDVLLDVPMRLSAELGCCQMPMREVLQLAVGAVVQLEKLADTPLDLFVNQKLFARGEVVVVEDRFGIKITEIVGKS